MKRHDFEEGLQYATRGIRTSSDQHSKDIHGLFIVDQFVFLELLTVSTFVSSLFVSLLLEECSQNIPVQNRMQSRTSSFSKTYDEVQPPAL